MSDDGIVADEDFLQDPELLWDYLPQPFRLINHLLEDLIDRALQQIEDSHRVVRIKSDTIAWESKWDMHLEQELDELKVVSEQNEWLSMSVYTGTGDEQHAMGFEYKVLVPGMSHDEGLGSVCVRRGHGDSGGAKYKFIDLHHRLVASSGETETAAPAPVTHHKQAAAAGAHRCCGSLLFHYHLAGVYGWSGAPAVDRFFSVANQPTIVADYWQQFDDTREQRRRDADRLLSVT